MTQNRCGQMEPDIDKTEWSRCNVSSMTDAIACPEPRPFEIAPAGGKNDYREAVIPAGGVLVHFAAVPVHAIRIVEDAEGGPCLACIKRILHDTSVPLRFSPDALVERQVA